MENAFENNYIPSPFNIFEPDPQHGAFILVKNLETGKLFRLPVCKSGDPIGQHTDSRWFKWFCAERLIIKRDDIENIIEKRLDDIFFSFPENETRAVFIPGYQCQLKCSYCYNAELRDCETDKKIIESELASQYIQFFNDTPAQTWSLTVTGGGEPLLYLKNILAITKDIQSAANALGRKFKLGIVTNGELLTKDNVKNLCKVGLSQVGVTLDPDHDASRPSKDGKPKKGKILFNLKILPKHVGLYISSNVKEGQEKAYETLLKKDLNPLNGKIKGIRANVQCNPIKKEAEEIQGKFSRLYRKKEIELTLELLSLVDSLGFKRELDKDGLIDCEAFKASEALILDAAGKRCFCPGLINVEKYQVNPFDETIQDKHELRLRNQPWREHCFDNQMPCPFLLKCFGGCRFISITQGSNWETINCEKPFLEAITRYNMKRMALNL